MAENPVNYLTLPLTCQDDGGLFFVRNYRIFEVVSYEVGRLRLPLSYELFNSRGIAG